MSDPKPKRTFEYQGGAANLQLSPTQGDGRQQQPRAANRSRRVLTQPEKKDIVERLIDFIKVL